jgi:hydroxymethylglutaryl-CoA reductase (NADPH)
VAGIKTQKINFFMSLKNLNYQQRVMAVEKETGVKLRHIPQISFDPEMVSGKNCEQVIGATQVPLGIAGPIEIDSFRFGKFRSYLPLATTEGALVASVNRGAKAVSLSKGVALYHEEVGASRGPCLKVKDIAQAHLIVSWLEENWQNLVESVAQTENHARLLSWQHQILGRNLYLKFSFATGEAMGMNMVTFATEKIIALIRRQFEFEYLLSGNFCSDKKPALNNFLLGRGKKVWAEAVIKEEVVNSVLKISPQQIVSAVHQKQHLGSIAAGAMGFNAHHANIVAALYLATGQDLGHVVEGSLGVTTAEMAGDDLYFSVFLPAVMVGTVGGGTGLPTQEEALALMGLNSAQKGEGAKLAEIVGAGVFAGELSLTAALASCDLAAAHQKYGRKQKI